MARLSTKPPASVIRAGKGKVDIYFHRGQFVARSWPRKTSIPATTKQKAQRARFTAAVKVVKSASAADINWAHQSVKGTQWTYKDYLMAAAYGKTIKWKSTYTTNNTSTPSNIQEVMRTPCATHVNILLKKAISGSVKVALTAIKPTSRHLVKEVLGALRNCGMEYSADAVSESNLIDGSDGLFELLELPTIASGTFLWWWIFGTEAGLVKAWVSSIGIESDCTPAAGFGTCQVHMSGTQLSVGTGNWQTPTLSQIIEDPGGWTGFGGTTIKPPDAGTYNVMFVAGASSFNSSSGTLNARIQISGGSPTQTFPGGSASWTPHTDAVIVGGMTLNINHPNTAINLQTMSPPNPLYFGTAIQKLVVSR
jgi:hypothetical protein